MKSKCRKKGCKAFPIKSSDYCFAHDHNRQAERLAECSRGGKTSMAPKTFSNANFKFNAIPDVKKMLGQTTNAVLNGEIDISRERTAGYLASLIIMCLKDHDLEKRMEAIEQKLAEMGKRL